MSKQREPVNPGDQERKVLVTNFRDALKSTAVQDIVWHILDQCGIYSESFTGNSQTFYLEGKRAVGLEVLRLMEEADPTAYPRLLLRKQNYKGVENA